VTRKSISILLRNVEGDVVRRWNVINAYPTKWDGPQLNTETNQVAIETLELTHHGLSLGE
jgi:phage tail-like protein